MSHLKTICLCLSVIHRLNQMHVIIPSLHIDDRKKNSFLHYTTLLLTSLLTQVSTTGFK